ncbi:hypothetical protein [Flammeovirga kamogawensis]|uniref:Uncharacterized protein n=1 Tax=Flammeovirga kamogawensis TaxID=373891 RepID=A0ABX8GRC1_9BACT|nr:hypothetical protein [Flammeovirga kamogawensis]MBB6462710.1 hypothetical protein [Flammeovirga kamogawensis]QWG06056.1 hypothetical protein KM029_11855 [Flammeovirga kamogawensis]TRX67889.1 hypothetical protein EO216_06880 [Flammeovirga kamogawensis]
MLGYFFELIGIDRLYGQQLEEHDVTFFIRPTITIVGLLFLSIIVGQLLIEEKKGNRKLKILGLSTSLLGVLWSVHSYLN